MTRSYEWSGEVVRLEHLIPALLTLECDCGRQLVGASERGLMAHLRAHWTARHDGELTSGDLRRLVGAAAVEGRSDGVRLRAFAKP